MTSEQNKTGLKTKTKEEIYTEFQQLRTQQRNLVTNLNTLELDLKEHKTVIDTLKTVDPSRKCFRLIGGVLVEQTVKEVLPQLESNRDKLDGLIEKGKEQITKKGEEILKYKDEHNIRVQGQPEGNAEDKSDPTSAASARNVLVVDNN
ncbi:probable prefoldin subunit 2 [Culicoides brevitarsis]|uniref:probable prefoldin subunit 2 n=1 Tax=Culicoides brevitarsis TaxID=469753 RepID=UPI00307C7048